MHHYILEVCEHDVLETACVIFIKFTALMHWDKDDVIWFWSQKVRVTLRPHWSNKHVGSHFITCPVSGMCRHFITCPVSVDILSPVLSLGCVDILSPVLSLGCVDILSPVLSLGCVDVFQWNCSHLLITRSTWHWWRYQVSMSQTTCSENALFRWRRTGQSMVCRDVTKFKFEFDNIWTLNGFNSFKIHQMF